MHVFLTNFYSKLMPTLHLKINNTYCIWWRARTTDIQRELFFKNSKLLGWGRQIGLKFYEVFRVFPANSIGTILSLWVPCSWESVAGSLSYKKLWFLGLKHITPKYSQNKILAVKNLGNCVHTSVFGAWNLNF